LNDICLPRTLTHAPYTHNHAYPTSRTWSRDGTTLLVESSGPGPGGQVGGGVRHLTAIDIQTLRETHLAAIEPHSPSEPSGCYQFDYAPGAHAVVYYDLGGRRMTLLHLATMQSGVVMEESEGVICGPPAISHDGTLVAWWATYPSVENRFFDSYVSVVFSLDVDPVQCRAAGEPVIVVAYPRRKGGTWAQDPVDGVHVNHPQINPADKGHLCYSHEMRGTPPDGSEAMSRLWEARADGSGNRCLVRQPAGLHFTHEVFAPDGKSLIFPYMHGVGQVTFDTGRVRSLYYNPECCPGHITVSPDGLWFAGETWGQEKHSIMMGHIPTRSYAHLCWIPMSHGHPSHPHANFSPDGDHIATVILDEDDNCQVAVIDVADVKARWDEVAEGTAEAASPQWVAAFGE